MSSKYLISALLFILIAIVVYLYAAGKFPYKRAYAPTASPTSSTSAIPLPSIGSPEVESMMVDLVKKEATASAATTSAQVVKVTPTVWPDASLGCPKMGVMYTQLVVPGYRVVVKVGNKQIEYHTDTSNNIVQCDK